jgi:VanZ family protein
MPSRSSRFIAFLPGLAWFFVVLILLCTPGNQLPKSKLFSVILFDKMVHVACFAGIVGLFYWPMRRHPDRRHYLIKLTLATVVWGITSELIQKFFIPFRSFDWFDFLADGIGAVLAGLLLLQRQGSGSGRPQRIKNR